MRSKFFRWAILGLILLSFGDTPAILAKEAALGSRFAPGEVIIKLRENSASALSDDVPGTVLDAVSGESLGAIEPALPRWRKIRLKGSMSVEDAVARLRAMPTEIEAAEPNWIYRAAVQPDSLVLESGAGRAERVEKSEGYVPQDKKFKHQWGMYNKGDRFPGSSSPMKKGADANLLGAWNISENVRSAAQQVVVAVIDTGISLTHKDLIENLWQNPGETGAWTPTNELESAQAAKNCRDRSCNGIDDDQNGYVDDVVGWNFTRSNAKPMDDNTHGTHVAGIIGATHNRRGVAGVNHRVKLMALKFLDRNGGGTLEGGIRAIVYAAKNGANVINASWGGSGVSQALSEAVDYAIGKGVLFVAAAGNSSTNNDFLPATPANIPGVLSVVASDPWDNAAPFSSYGKATTHIAAPGVQILSTTRTRVTAGFPLLTLLPIYRNGYGYLSGTSMATPFVAGIAAMVIGLNPSLKGKPAALIERLKQSSDIQSALISRTNSGGRVNAENAIRGIITPGHNRPASERWSDLVRAPFESPHPYSNGAAIEHTIRHAGAKWIRVVYGRFGIETYRDSLEVRDGSGALVDALTGFGDTATSFPVEGDEVRLVFRSNDRVDGWGYEVLGYQYMN